MAQAQGPGIARVLAQSPFARPRGGELRFDLKPRIAARDKWRRIEGIQRLKAFLRDYRDAWEKRRFGTANVVFPAGTYLLQQQSQRRHPPRSPVSACGADLCGAGESMPRLLS